METNKFNILNSTHSVELSLKEQEQPKQSTQIKVKALIENNTDKNKHASLIFICNLTNDEIEVDVEYNDTDIHTSELLVKIGEEFDIFTIELNKFISQYINDGFSTDLPDNVDKFKVKLLLPYPQTTDEINIGYLRSYVRSYLVLAYPLIRSWKAIRLDFESITKHVNKVEIEVIVKKVYD